ncbi:MAG: alanine--tRNA ligase [Anaerolineales bacterium]
MNKPMTGAEIRQSFIDFFAKKYAHTYVHSASLVPGGDATLLFTNAGMVQFKDVFLGTDKRPYTRAVNSQKCMRVAGKHNDLDDVGRDDTHHTLFEMLGNWSFGDYYKKEAIAWSWELLTEVWGLPKDKLWATVFRDEKGEIPQDDEAAEAWRAQPGFDPAHVLFFGRKENFWEMADTGPCGPCSEIHVDRGEAACNKQHVPGHVCRVNGDCTRFTEIWNNVFIQYNRTGPSSLEPLPATHVDTGMGLERIVSIIQNAGSNYRTDLLFPLIQTTQKLTGQTDAERDANFTPYRVIADHARAATFLIGDGVVPGNVGRNYICRMIIRRAARFGSKIGLTQPFLAQIAEVVIQNYGDFFPEIRKNRALILESLTREEERFSRTVEAGTAKLQTLIESLQGSQIPGDKAFDLYATYGMPMEITRDIAREHNLDVDEAGFRTAMEAHRLASGAGEAFGPLGGEDVDIYRGILQDLQARGKLGPEGVAYNPYDTLRLETELLAIVRDGQPIERADPGDKVEVILPETCFYVESGGQVSDTGSIRAHNGTWSIRILDTRKPAAGVIVHMGEVVFGLPTVGETALAQVDAQRRADIMRNHTATHLLHAALHEVVGGNALQAGSLVAPDRLRFDFSHSQAVSREQLTRIEEIVNQRILEGHVLNITYKPLTQAKAEGATALFGEKYADIVRTITIGGAQPFSYELCGGTHVRATNDIGSFYITSEGSVSAGVRRIEAVTGRAAFNLSQQRRALLDQTAQTLDTPAEKAPEKAANLLEELSAARKQIAHLRQTLAALEFSRALDDAATIENVAVLTTILPEADEDALRSMADRFRQRYPHNGVAVLASVLEGKPRLVAAVTEDLVKRGIKAGDLVKFVAEPLGGGGGGRPTLATGSGKDPANLREALAGVSGWVEEKLK